MEPIKPPIDNYNPRSKCGCITKKGKPCKNSEFCHIHKEAKNYLYTLPGLPCYDELQYYPLYTEQFTREELNELNIYELYSLYENYKIDQPKDNLLVILHGQSPLPLYTRGIYKELSKLYPFPKQNLLNLDKKIILIEGLLVYYKVINKYGINIDILPKNLPDNISKEIPDPIINANNDIEMIDQFKTFRDKYFNWFLEQAEQLLFFDSVIPRYINYSFRPINDACRQESKVLFDEIANLINAFTMVSPLPEDIVVFRYLSKFPYKLNEISIEKGFMSVSISYRNQENRLDKKIKHYLQLYIPKGTILLNLLLYNATEYELLLPPDTRFKIYKEEKIDKTNMYYGYLV